MGKEFADSATEPEPIGPGTIFRVLLGQSAQRRIWLQFFCASAIFAALWTGWRFMREKSLADGRYQAGRRDILTLSPPPWISPHFIDEVLAYRKMNGSTGVNITDRKAIEDLFVAFTRHPWVKRVESLEIAYPARIFARLEFRVPTALVEAAAEQYGPEFRGGVFPIDAEGVLLPSDYLKASQTADPGSVFDYIWISGIRSTPMGGVGEPWNDPRLEEAALLAEMLRDDFSRLGIQKIAVRPTDESKIDGQFDLETRRGAKIYWGTFPAAGVISARKLSNADERYTTLKNDLFSDQRSKIDALTPLIRTYGSLDDLPADLTPLDISEK